MEYLHRYRSLYRGYQKREVELFEQLKNIINSTKIGKFGYVYIFNRDGIILVHPLYR